MKTIEELIEDRNNLLSQVSAIDTQIQNFKDGFEYAVRVSSFGPNCVRTFTNQLAAEEHVNQYNGDNGVASLYTNNPTIQCAPFYAGGSVYHVPDVKLVKAYQHPDNAIRIAFIDEVVEENNMQA